LVPAVLISARLISAVLATAVIVLPTAAAVIASATALVPAILISASLISAPVITVVLLTAAVTAMPPAFGRSFAAGEQGTRQDDCGDGADQALHMPRLNPQADPSIVTTMTWGA
jgi:hypothetical protein